MGIKTGGMCSTGRKSGWMKKGREMKEKEERRETKEEDRGEGKGVNLTFVKHINIPQRGANEEVTEGLEILPCIGTCRRNSLPIPGNMK